VRTLFWVNVTIVEPCRGTILRPSASRPRAAPDPAQRGEMAGREKVGVGINV
jgi:hypothetical protein